MGQLASVLNSHCAIGSGKAAYSYTAYHPAGSCMTTVCTVKYGCVCTQNYTTNTPYTVNVPAVPDDTCVIVNHSGSDNVVRLLLATYDDLWNIRAVYTSAGAGGGSEVASALLQYNGAYAAGSSLSDTDSPGNCGFTWWMDVDTARSGYGLGRWAWDDTNGRPIYHLIASGETWVDVGSAALFPGMNDGGVAIHSSLGLADVGYFILRAGPNGTSTYDEGPNGFYYGHSIPGDPSGTLYGMAEGAVTHFTAKRAFFTGDPSFFSANNVYCRAYNDPGMCLSPIPDPGSSWYDQFLNGLVNGGVCLIGCSGHDYTCAGC